MSSNKSIFMTTLQSMCGAHNKSPWDDKYYIEGYPDREGLDYPQEERDQVDTVDFEGW